MKNKILLFMLCAGIAPQTCAMQRNLADEAARVEDGIHLVAAGVAPRRPVSLTKKVILGVVGTALILGFSTLMYGVHESETPLKKECKPELPFVVQATMYGHAGVILSGVNFKLNPVEGDEGLDLLTYDRGTEILDGIDGGVNRNCLGSYTCTFTEPRKGKGKCVKS